MPIPDAVFGELAWIVAGYFFLASVVTKMRPALLSPFLPKNTKRVSAHSCVLVACHAVIFGCMYRFPVAKGGLFWLTLIVGIAATISIVWDYLPN
jgi:cyanate permease